MAVATASISVTPPSTTRTSKRLPATPTPNEAPSQALSSCSVLHLGTQGTRGQQCCYLSSLYKKKYQPYMNLTQCPAKSGRPFPVTPEDLSFTSEQSTKAGRDHRLPPVPSTNLKVCRKLNANTILLKIQAATEQRLRSLRTLQEHPMAQRCF